LYRFVHYFNFKIEILQAVTIFGVCGGCRRQELCDVKVQHVKDEGAVIVVRIPDTKTHVSRAFTILSDGNGFNPIDLVRQYMKLRPSHTKIDRFFLSYRNKKCTVQPVGIKTIGKFPSIIAKYLGLENAASYTGHCYRRTSATLLANAGADVLTLKRHGSWKSSTVAENYVAESMCNKIKIAKMIQCGDGIETNSNISNKENETPVVSVSNKNISLEIESNNQKMIAGNLHMTFKKKSKCVINVYNSKN
jgi:integrase